MSSQVVWHPDLPSVILAVKCPVCGQVVRGMVRSDKLLERVVNGPVITEVYLAALATFANYDEMAIEMEDGSLHMVPVCKSCKVDNPDQQKILEHSKDTMQEEARKSGSMPVPVRFMALNTKQHADKIKAEKDKQKDAGKL